MPIYEYECNACGAKLEFIQKFSDAPRADCTACGATNSLRRLISSPAIQFKGDGWYVTDYSAKGKQSKQSSKDEASSNSAPSKDSSPATNSSTPAAKDEPSGS